MDNEITTKRGMVLILVIATVGVFVGLVWLIATYLPRGLFGFPGPSFTTSGARIEKNCTYPISYWKEHPELYPPQIVLGGKVYQVDDIQAILSAEGQDPSTQIQAQLVGVFLNNLSGADQSLIETTIFQAYSWLVQHQDGNQVSESEREVGLRYFNVLEAYNLGLAGVSACQTAAAFTLTTTATASGIPTLSSTITPSQTLTPTPSETASPTGQQTTPMQTVVFPSQTPIPTTAPPGGPSATPNRTIAPTLTNTAIKTTEAPTPTRTSPPAATPTLPPTPNPPPTLPPPD